MEIRSERNFQSLTSLDPRILTCPAGPQTKPLLLGLERAVGGGVGGEGKGNRGQKRDASMIV